MNAPAHLPLHLAAAQVREGALSPSEWVSAHARRLEGAWRLGAFTGVDVEGALRAAAALPLGGALPPLAGAPLAIKDNLCTLELPTTCGAELLRGFVSPYEATAVKRLREGGGVVLGKANLDAFGFGSQTQHSCSGPTLNPWSEQRSPGGSSGGSAVAVAAGLAAAALGSDTGGSVRLPAAWCGVVGLRPTWGRVSRLGLVAFASSLDQVGVLCRDVADAALLLEVISGPDPGDATCAHAPPVLGEGWGRGVGGLRVGIPSPEVLSGCEEEVAARLYEAAHALEEQGARRVEIGLPHLREGLAAYHLIAAMEAASNLARFDGLRYGRAGRGVSLEEVVAQARRSGLGEEVQIRLVLGRRVLADDALRSGALRVRGEVRAAWGEALARADVVLCPVSPTLPLSRGEPSEQRWWEADLFTVGPSLAGLPAVSVPAGLGGEGLPLAVQCVGPAWQEGLVLEVARGLERRFGVCAPTPAPWWGGTWT